MPNGGLVVGRKGGDADVEVGWDTLVSRRHGQFWQQKGVVWYRDLDDALEQIQAYLGRDRERKRVAAAGHELVMGRHR